MSQPLYAVIVVLLVVTGHTLQDGVCWNTVTSIPILGLAW
jgi:hypothetical protein